MTMPTQVESHGEGVEKGRSGPRRWKAIDLDALPPWILAGERDHEHGRNYKIDLDEARRLSKANE
jgi:hypothetical protein